MVRRQGFDALSVTAVSSYSDSEQESSEQGPELSEADESDDRGCMVLVCD